MSEVKIMLSANFTELENGQTYYARVYTVNPEGYMQSEIGTQIGSATPQDFPAVPSAYNLIGTYTTAQTWTVPEDGWFKVEVFGASGNGGKAKNVAVDTGDGSTYYLGATGGGGGGGGYAASVVKMKQGNTVVINPGAAGVTTSAVFNSSMETYDTISVTSGGNGGDGWAIASTGSGGGGSGGSGGSAYGGNLTNVSGTNGSAGTKKSSNSDTITATGGNGGAAAHSDGNAGGRGGGLNNGYVTTSGTYAPVAGKAAFVKISRGNTNIVA